MNRRLSITAIFVLALAIVPAVKAEDVEAKLGIDQVTVYVHGAAVTRRGDVSLPAGEHRLIVRGLPDPIDPGSLRVSAASRAVRLGGVELERIVTTDFVSDAESSLRKKLQSLEDQRATVEDDIRTAQMQLKLIDSLTALPVDREGKAVIDGAALPATLTAVGNGATAARAKIRAAQIAARPLDDDIAATKAEIEKVRTAKKSTTEVRATIVASAAVTVPVSIEYRVNDAAWQWLYEARLDTQDKSLSFLRQAAISQGSGEDWPNAEITVTTAKPSADAGTPRVASQFLRLQQYPPRAATGATEEIVVTGNRLYERRAAAPQDEASRITADVFATDFIAEYRIPGRVSISANRQARVYPISEEAFNPELIARAVLYASRDARIEATFKYGRDTPIDAGRVQLYRDGAYVGDAMLPLLLPGSDVRIPFGIDDRIRVVVRDERAESGPRGVAGRQALNEYRRRYEITSYHATALPIEIIDRVPVPQESGITVQVLEGATPPMARDLDGKAGVYLWRLDGTPRKTETIRHYYSVRYPSDRSLAATEAGE